MFSLNEFTLTKVEETNKKGEFLLGPLPKGFGYTLANMLRRLLYSSVSGVAITSVQIDGVKHEYSSLAGVKDDTLYILQNLRQVVFRANTDESTDWVLKLEKKGKGFVTAADFEKNSAIEVVNPEAVITELTDNVDFSLEITLHKSRGYSFVDQTERSTINLIPVDPIYSPVTRVSYDVEDARSGQEFGLDRIRLVVETNGSVNPSEALTEASEVLNVVTAHLVEINNGKLAEVRRSDFENSAPAANARKVDLTLTKINVSTRLFNCLDKIGVTSLLDLEGKTKKEIQDIKGLGDKSKKELLKLLQKYDISILE